MPTAWLEGRGTVNGRGDYGYRLIANDSTSKDGVGGLRFVIWDRVARDRLRQPAGTIPFGDQRALLASVGGGSIEIQAQNARPPPDASTEYRRAGTGPHMHRARAYPRTSPRNSSASTCRAS